MTKKVNKVKKIVFIRKRFSWKKFRSCVGQTWAATFFPFFCIGRPKGLCLALYRFVFMSFLMCLEKGMASSCFLLRSCWGEGEFWF